MSSSAVPSPIRAPRRLGLLLVAWVLAGPLLGWLGAGASGATAGQDAEDPVLADPPQVETRPAAGGLGSDGCLRCHTGIEDMHPWAALSCVDCHGGDPEGRTKLEAHVQPIDGDLDDERVPPPDKDLAYRRFVNPSDLRITGNTCGVCHGELCKDLQLSLHGTTAGHLSDGFYEMGLSGEKGSRFSVFPVPAHLTDEGEVDKLVQPPAFDSADDPLSLASHFPDLVRKECMQCHLWSRGRAVRGRVGFDGDYRGDGCAACHVPYARNGLSDSADRSVNRNEPGHPRRHVMTTAPSTQTCTSCHYGDASIGLHFRGLSQLPPGAPGGPEIEGTTDSPLNRVFYLDDPALVPPDVHHELGLHCVDCHTLSDVMGDGALHGQMEYAVEIRCQSCHGSFTERATLRTARGAPLPHLERKGQDVYLTSKVTGQVHRVTQVPDVLDPGHRDHNPQAARAMTAAHGDVECYTCHAGWNVNFLGFHFYRNEALTQLDLLSGRRTPGRVTTQEKVFSTWKSFYAGRNAEGRIAPYLTGFSTMGTVDAADGTRLLDQAMPVTSAGLSGMTMVHHQLHSTRPTARSCVECHRSSGTWGLGTANFRLARQVAFVADRRGIEVVALNRQNLAASLPLAKFVLPDIVDMELACDPLQGHARTLYVSEGGRGVHVLDVSDPVQPRRVAFVECISPRGMALGGEHLYVADGVGGLRVFDVSDPARIHRVGQLPMFDAHEVELRWPLAYVADGPGGLAVVDVRAPISPKLVGGVTWTRGREKAVEAIDLDVLFQYSRPETLGGDVPAPYRSDARNLCAVLDRERGPILVDVTEPTRPKVVYPDLESGRSQASTRRENFRWRGLALRSHTDLATPQGGERTAERDYLYALEERLLDNGDGRSFVLVIDVSDPTRPRNVARVESGDQSEMLVHASFYNQPFLQPVALVPGDDGVFVTDVSISREPNQLGVLTGIRNAYVIAVEEFPLDEMVDEGGRPLKDVSHPRSRWLGTAEIARILDVDARRLGLVDPEDETPTAPGASARAFFARHDGDHDGLLTGDELARAGGTAVDRNGDGRATLAEVADLGLVFTPEETQVEAEATAFENPRTTRDGDLARLLDGTDPHAHDRDGDRRLDRKEAARALFDALDLDDDGKLDRAELSRHPGRPRDLRFGDANALAQFGKRDLNRGGTITVREFQVADEEWAALDRDGDGAIQLEPRATDSGRPGGTPPPVVEWPRRQDFAFPLPPNASRERILEALDQDGDAYLSKRELKRRPDLLETFDTNRDGVLDRDEFGRPVDLIGRLGLEACADGFLQRWDLDGDGELSPEELPEFARLVVRRPGRK